MQCSELVRMFQKLEFGQTCSGAVHDKKSCPYRLPARLQNLLVCLLQILQVGLLVLDEADNVVEAVLDGVWLLADILTLLALGDGGGLLGLAVLLLGLGLWAVLVEELEGLDIIKVLLGNSLDGNVVNIDLILLN